MKKLRLLALLVVATLPFAACSDNGTPAGNDTGTLQGTVVVEGTPQAGVTVAISGPQSATATTDANGHYAFQSVPTGTYTIEISGFGNDVTFSTTSKTGNVAAGTSQTVDFSGDYIRTAVISGKVVANSTDTQANVAGITVTLSGTETRTTQTDSNGEFVFDGLRAGTYTVSIDITGLDLQIDQTSQQVQVSVGQTAEVTFTGVVPQSAQMTIGSLNQLASNVAGVLNVNMNVDPGNETVSHIAVSLNGTEAWSQDVSLSSASSGASKVGSYPVQAVINTANFDPQTLEVDWPNGDYELTATLETSEGSTSTATYGSPVTFNNTDILRVVHMDGPSAVSGGTRWYGGGDQMFRAEVVLYSQAVSISQIGVTGTRGVFGNGNQQIDLGDGPGAEHFIDGPGPFDFTMAAADNSPASGGAPGGVEDAPGSVSTIQITSVNDADGVDILTSFATPTAFQAPLDFTAPVVNTPAPSVFTVNTATPPAAPPTTIGAGGQYFSTGGFGLTNSSEGGVGGTTRTFVVDDAATSTDPDFPGVGGIDDVAERQPSNYTVEITGMSDALGNAVDFATNTVAGGNNTSAGWGVDKGAPNVTNILPAAGAPVIINPNDQDNPANTADNDASFTVADPNLADGNPGSGANAPTGSAVRASTGTSAALAFTNPTPGDYVIDLAQAAFPADDQYTVTMDVADNAIAANNTEVVWTIVIDGTAPNTTMINAPASSVTSSNASLTFTIQGSATDANGLSKVLVTVREELGAGNTAGVCDLGDPLVTDTGSGATGNMTTASYDVTGNAAGFTQQVTLSNPGAGAQTVCFFIESSDNALDVNGNPEPNTSNQSATTQINWN